MKIIHKLLLGFGIVIISVLLAGAWGFYGLTQATSYLNNVIEIDVRRHAVVNDIYGVLMEQMEDIHEYVTTMELDTDNKKDVLDGQKNMMIYGMNISRHLIKKKKLLTKTPIRKELWC